MIDTSPRRARYAGLDGLRAIAVALVVAYHLFPQWIFVGGFVGVDVFFVISGFLITSLLLTEHEATGTLHLGGFWRRRARRLLPALVLVVAVCASAAWLVGGDVLARMGTQIVGAATFSYNWVSLSAGADYFASSSPELFRNLWSLAVEEQFYVLWPLLLPVLLLLRARGARLGVLLVAAAVSAWWMARLTGDGALTRAYFGTDAHAFGILLGVALAVALRALPHEPAAWMTRRRWRALSLVVGGACVGALVGIGMLPADGTAATFPGAMLAASGITVVAVVAGTWPRSWFGRAVDIAPLRWIGDRSYGLYLWHWPLLVLLTSALDDGGPRAGVPVGVGVLALALTVVAAEVSYRGIEMPVRRLGFRGALRALGRAAAGSPPRRLGVITAVAASLLAICGTTAAIAGAPSETSAEEAVQAGMEALAHRDGAPRLAPSPAASRAPLAVPTPTPVAGEEITAVGDSVMLASAPALMARFPGIDVDASVSRSMYAGPGILEQLAGAGTLRPYVVVGLGTNGTVDPAALDRVWQLVGPDRDLILVTAHAPREWIAGVNAELRSFAAAHEGVEVADWSGSIAAQDELLAGDKIHPGPAGGEVFADTVAQALDSAHTERLRRQYERERQSFQLNQRLLERR